MSTRVMVAMSGGVDSSVAAAILKEKGFEAIGATFKFWPKEKCLEESPRSCCSLRDIEDARKVAGALGIAHYVLDCEEEFEREIIDYFCNEYLNGKTPNPCILCNEKIKFTFLLRRAEELKCEYIATGHYAALVFEPKSARYLLKEAKDKQRDQSYVLFSLAQKKLARILFPLGEFTKDEVRAVAMKRDLRVHNKPDSQEICFVQEGDYAGFLKKRLNGKIKPGPIVDTEGKIVGSHEGICFYTIGQRKAIGAHFGRPKYVTKIVARENKIIIGDYEDIMQRSFYVERLNWLLREEPPPQSMADQPAEGGAEKAPIQAKVKIRYLHPKADALIYPEKDMESTPHPFPSPLRGEKGVVSPLPFGERVRVRGQKSQLRARVEFSTPQPAITPGQAAVFYDGEVVLGGGWIV